MKISLVIPTLDAGPLLEQVLTAVERQPGAGALERVAVDSGSSDETVATLERHGFRVLAIDKSTFDHGATRDLAISHTSGDVIVLLTQDAVPANDAWLPRLVEVYEDANVGAAYCRQIPRDDCNPILARRLLEWTAGQEDPVVQRVASHEEFAALPPLERLRVCAYDNVAGSVRRRTWERIRFGQRRFGEDVAFGKQVVLSGESIVFQPKSAVIHSHNRSAKAEGKRIYCDHRNLKELFGVHVLPTFGAFVRAVRESQQHFAALVAALELRDAEREALRQWAMSYAFWSALGTYLGGNADRLGRGLRAPFFGVVDRHMRRGI